MNYFSVVIGKLDQFKDSAAPSQGNGYFGQSAFLSEFPQWAQFWCGWQLMSQCLLGTGAACYFP